MIDPALLRPVADVLKLFGNNGTLIVKFRPQALADFKESEPVFALMDGIPVPFFITSFQSQGNDRARILFDSIYQEGQALELIGKTLYLPHPKAKANKSKQQLEDPDMLIGFSVSDSQQGPLGIVDAFMDWDMNPCLSIRTADGTGGFLVPFQPAFIQAIDFTTNHIHLILPEGLKEVNASKF